MSTPIKNAWRKRVDNLATGKGNNHDINTLEVGDFIAIPSKPGISSGVTGFVKKISRVNLIIETIYGGWADSDATLMELKIKKADVVVFLKPKQQDAELSKLIEETRTKLRTDESFCDGLSIALQSKFDRELGECASITGVNYLIDKYTVIAKKKNELMKIYQVDESQADGVEYGKAFGS